MSFWSRLKDQLKVMLLIYIFIVSGLAANFAMLVCCVIWPFDKTLYRKIAVHLAYSFWSQFTCVAQWFAGSDCILYVDDEDYPHIGKEHVLVMMNHKYDIDWLMTWILSERFTMLGNTKIYGKEILRYVPLIGWAWYFTESIFLKRQWEKDQEIIKKDIKMIAEYPEDYPVTFLLFPEGTRFTPEKHLASTEIAKQKGYPDLKHHLLPRTKGFILSMHGMKGVVPVIYDLTIAFDPKDPTPPTLWSIIKGKKVTGHLYFRRIKIDDVPLETDEACADWLRQQYKIKDDIYEYYMQHRTFDKPARHVPRRYHDLLMWLFWAAFTLIPSLYGLSLLLASGSVFWITVFFMVVFLLGLVIHWMIGFTVTEKGSAYGRVHKME